MDSKFPKIKRGLEAELVNVSISDGQLLITTDTKKLYADVGDQRIQLGMDMSDSDVTPADMLSGKIAYVKGKRIVGTIPSKAATTYTPNAAGSSISSGYYLTGDQVLQGDSDLKASNIRKDVTIFGYTGTLNQFTLSWSRTSSGSYTFSKSGTRWTSNNKGVQSSSATATWTLTCPIAKSYTLHWAVSSESSYDKLTVTFNGSTKVSAQSGSNSGDVSLSLVAGTNTITATYSKDGSVDKNNDNGYIDLPDVVITI